MSRKYHCDICDRVFIPGLFEGFRWRCLFVGERVDLCPTCKESYVKWFKEARSLIQEKGTGEN